MKRWIGGLLALTLLCAASVAVRAAEAADPNAILDKAIQALGGKEKLEKVKAFSWTSKGSITFQGQESSITFHVTAQGLDHRRQDFEGEFGGNQVQGKILLSGDKGLRDFGGNKTELAGSELADEKRNSYLNLLPVTLTPLKGKDYKLETLAGEMIDNKPAVGLKITPPDGKEFRLYFDAESGLPIRVTAKVNGFDGVETTEETTFSDYQEMAGIKKATRVVSRRDGEPFLTLQVSEFKLLEQVDPKTFTE